MASGGRGRGSEELSLCPATAGDSERGLSDVWTGWRLDLLAWFLLDLVTRFQLGGLVRWEQLVEDRLEFRRRLLPAVVDLDPVSDPVDVESVGLPHSRVVDEFELQLVAGTLEVGAVCVLDDLDRLAVYDHNDSRLEAVEVSDVEVPLIGLDGLAAEEDLLPHGGTRTDVADELESLGVVGDGVVQIVVAAALLARVGENGTQNDCDQDDGGQDHQSVAHCGFLRCCAVGFNRRLSQ